MRYKINFWIAFVVLTALCWIDYQYYTEGAAVNNIPERTRQLMHLVILTAILPVGYYGWMKHPISWIKKLWLFPYILVVLAISLIGVIQIFWHPFNIEMLDIVSNIRLFFCSPMPYMILYLFSLLVQKGNILSEKQS